MAWKDDQGRKKIRRYLQRPLKATDETRALHEWLRASPERALEMLQQVSVTNTEAVAFRVLRP